MNSNIEGSTEKAILMCAITQLNIDSTNTNSLYIYRWYV